LNQSAVPVLNWPALYSQNDVPLWTKHLPPRRPAAGARRSGFCTTFGARFWQLPFDPSTKPLSQVILTH
jgi:hypothetical protein